MRQNRTVTRSVALQSYLYAEILRKRRKQAEHGMRVPTK